ncbi:MAG: M23 family metallopeptidase, partial [Actinomycetota bacterium]|nr:M23 family metallopeptidase [Actinomycetota bacterium]
PYADPAPDKPADKPAKKPARKPAKKPPAKKGARGQTKPPPIRTPPPPAAKGHRFPLVGAFTFGGKDSRFGAGRRGHTHQGQDVAAAEGTPVVAPRTGTVEVVRYQASGAGHYIVLDGEGEDRDYVFMHLLKDSTIVKVGDQVARGQQIAQVGSTGSSSGPHLHFEIWVGGGWYTGGQPIDPLPFLNAWLQ